jgi:hypothetical protein
MAIGYTRCSAQHKYDFDMQLSAADMAESSLPNQRQCEEIFRDPLDTPYSVTSITHGEKSAMQQLTFERPVGSTQAAACRSGNAAIGRGFVMSSKCPLRSQSATDRDRERRSHGQRSPRRSCPFKYATQASSVNPHWIVAGSEAADPAPHREWREQRLPAKSECTHDPCALLAALIQCTSSAWKDCSSRWMTARQTHASRDGGRLDDDPDSDKYGFDMPV